MIKPATQTDRATPAESQPAFQSIAGGAATRLNIFQQTMLGWNSLHPYNAIHVVQIVDSLDLDRLRAAIAGTLTRHGLTNLRLDRAKGTYHYEGGPAPIELKVISDDRGAGPALHAAIEHELNTAFRPGEVAGPFRFFVEPQPGRFSLGIVYFHAVADAESVVLLLKDVVEVYLKPNDALLFPSFNLSPPCFDSVLRHYPGVFFGKLAAYPALLRGLRRSCRPPYRDHADFHNGFSFFSLALKRLRALVEAEEARGVTLNDLLLALLLRSLSPLSANRTGARKRKRITVGCIVNLRKDHGLDGQRVFGLFLGSFLVSHEVPGSLGLMALARDIRRQTHAIKQDRLYLGAPLEMAIGRFTLAFFSTSRRKKFYQKNYPLWGGVTNMNVNSLWKQSAGEQPIDYFRAVSTGPVTPLVMSATTVGDRVNIGLTYRTTVFSAPDIDQFKREFLASLNDSGGQPWAQK